MVIFLYILIALQNKKNDLNIFDYSLFSFILNSKISVEGNNFKLFKPLYRVQK